MLSIACVPTDCGGTADDKCMSRRPVWVWHSALTTCYERLLAAGKAKKVALVACMRKLLTILNAMVKHQTPWQPREVAIA